MALPIKTTEEDILVLADYLDHRVGFTPLAQIRSTVEARHADSRKIEAMRFIGLLERDDENVKLTDEGHAFARATGEKREQIIAAQLKAIPLYQRTLEWMHFQHELEADKTQVAQFWHDKQGSLLDGSEGAALTDAVVLFMRLVGMSGLGRFVVAGIGRKSHVEMDSAQLAAAVTGAAAPAARGDGATRTPASQSVSTPPASAPQPATETPVAVVGSGVHINIEVHVAADAQAATVRDIFRNMRKYVLGLPDIDEKKS